MNDKSEANGSAPNGSGSIGKSLGILALFALIGFGAVYVTLGRPDNAAIQEKAAQNADAGAQTGKTDAKDAVHLARLLRLDEFTAVAVPTPDQEHARDLVRTREDARSDPAIGTTST